ncbi:MAG TPA: SAM-dependent methyltransferase [Gemmatimonadales bacterium]|jgi:methyltransferase (TIGR00027 family)|nr:SAM-dependent methyltransferase [Gemmatimonadales bacterium]
MTDAKLINHVSDTARWVAVYRAMETERPDAIFSDPFARRLAGERGEAIVQGMPKGRQMSWPMVVRTAVMDEIIMRCITKQGVDCVLNLAAGLDARPWRLPLAPTLRWIDVDHPVMIDLKLGELAKETPRCQYEGVRLDLADVPARKALFDRVDAASRRVLVITEGLLVYLPALAVAELARDLYREGSFQWWLMDLASPGLLKMLAKNWGKVVAEGNAPFQFGPAESTGFFEPLGWRELEWRVMMDESIRLKRMMPMAKFWKFVGSLAPRKKQEEFKRFSGIALLGRS